MSASSTLLDTKSPFGTYRAEGLVRAAWRLADRHDLSKGLRKRIRALVSRFFRGPYDAEADGLKFRLYPGQNYDDRKILSKGRLPERAEHKLLKPYLSSGTVFVDVGANIGSYSLFAADAGARVLAVEANPETAQKLAFNISANAKTDIELVNVAIGAEEGTLALWQEPSNCGFATLVEDLTTGEWAGDWSPRDVDVKPLDAVLAERGLQQVDVLKVDVEGFEDRVLVPFLRKSDKALWPKVVMIETNCRSHWAEDCLPLLADLGYGLAGETEDNMVFELKG